MGEDTVGVLTTHAGLAADEVDALIAGGAAYVAAAPEATLRRPYIDDAEALGIRRMDA
jgi:hypothetical protein